MSGQPSYFKTPEELEEKVNEYFESIKGEFHMEEMEQPDGSFEDMKVWDVYPEPATITGLCLFLGFESRQSFHDYAKRDGFSYAIKKSRLRVEHEYEKLMNQSKQPTAQIFALKNLGWSDKQEIDHSSTDGSMSPKTTIKFS